MKIENELLASFVQNSQELKKSDAKQTPETDFAAMLAQELEVGSESSPLVYGMAKTDPLAANLSALTPAHQISSISEDMDNAVNQIAGILDMLENYGSVLAGKDGLEQEDLKSAYNILEQIRASTSELKKSLTDLGNNSILSDIMNEVEVMTATEKFKLNRGDYLM